MERALRIESFRNIGFKDGKPSCERLVINNSLNKGELGDLIILIGANNSGKSNVLSALSEFGNSQITERDVTDLYSEEECRKPSLILSARDSNKDNEFAYKVVYGNADEIVFPEADNKELQYITVENFLKSLDNLAATEMNAIGTSILKNLYNKICEEHKEKEITKSELQGLVDEVFAVFENKQNTNPNNTSGGNQAGFVIRKRLNKNALFSYARNNVFVQEYGVSHILDNTDIKAVINSKYQEKFGYNFVPRIIQYVDKNITSRELSADYGNITNNHFFKAVFKSIDFDIEKVVNAYRDFNKLNNRGILSREENQINKKFKKLSEKFNRLYYVEDNNYSFKINLDSDMVYFSIFRGEQSLTLDYQSAGFKWFFNLFFNLLNTTDLKPGDIIIMDEPATNLHVKGQRELRGFLKEFAIKNDISIVIATHSPFLIDLDYLDEIRVIVNKDNISSIENNFAAVNENDPDSLLPIKESLTVENHILCNPEEKIVFVEGITDYNYLTAFKKLLGKTSITFLPINGVGTTKDECIKITQRLMKIRKKDPILLVDNDKAGSCMKEVNKGNKDFTIISLKEANESFKDIESLFSKTDLEKYNLIDSDGKFVKHASTSSVFKNQILKNNDSVSEETKNNFAKLFDKIFEITE